jgi:hypothetical protein
MLSIVRTASPARRTAAALAAALGCLAFASAAQANSSCAFDPVNHALTVASDASVEYTTIGVSRGAISASFDGATSGCGGARTTTVDSITATGPGFNTVQFDASDGAFAPGSTAEAGGTSEIELAARGYDAVVYLAPLSRPAVLAAGKDGLSLDGDDDLDLAYGAATSIGFGGSNAGSVISAQGGYGSGGPLPKRIGFVVRSANGATSDTVTGHGGLDQLDLWGAASATAYGLGGDDQITTGAGAGPYLVDGGDGDDFIVLHGAASAAGGAGADTFQAADGQAETIVGGAGRDVAEIDAALDTVTGVESVNPS